MSFTKLFIDFTKEYESPTSFWKWASYALVGAAIRDGIYYDHGARRTYPNIYVVLLADSAEYRKGAAPQLVTQLLNKTKLTKVVSGRTSVQAILDKLSQDIGTIKGGSGILVADELASFFVNDPALVPLITDIYDFREIYNYNLRSGDIIINNLCVTMLAASNETFLREVYNTAAVYGGLLGRTIMVKPDETRPANDLLDVDLTKYNTGELVDGLNKIRMLKGKSTATPDAKRMYKIWYNALYESYKKVKDRTGLTQRMHTTTLKLAMILAASNYTLEINVHHMEEAITEMTGLKSNYEVYAMSAGKSEQAEIGALFLQSLWNAPGNKITRDEILRIHWNMMSNDDLEKLTTTLNAAKLIQCDMNGNGTGYTYTMTDRCKDIFLKKESGK